MWWAQLLYARDSALWSIYALHAVRNPIISIIILNTIRIAVKEVKRAWSWLDGQITHYHRFGDGDILPPRPRLPTSTAHAAAIT